MLARLKIFLSQATQSGLIKIWGDSEIGAGEVIHEKIMNNLETCEIFLCLISQDYIASRYCYQVELERALQRREAGERIAVIPIILKRSGWTEDNRLRQLLALPTDGKPVSTWHDQDEAYHDIARGIVRAATKLQEKPKIEEAPLHLSRDGEEECCQRLQGAPALIHIHGPADHGKTVTLHHLIRRAKAQEYRTAVIYLNGFDQQCFEDPNRFKLAFCAAAGRCLGVPPPAEAVDQQRPGGISFLNSNIESYFSDSLIPAGSGPIVVAIDDLDRINVNREITNDICGLLRSWHEKASESAKSPWRQVRPILAFSRRPEVTQVEKSPFNVGHTLRLQAFSRSELADLQTLHRLNLSAAQQDDLMAWLGGHPKLLTKALAELARGTSFPKFMQQVCGTGGIYQSELEKLYRQAQNPRIATTIQRLCASSEVIKVERDCLEILEGLDWIELQESYAKLPIGLFRHHLSRLFARSS